MVNTVSIRNFIDGLKKLERTIFIYTCYYISRIFHLFFSAFPFYIDSESKEDDSKQLLPVIPILATVYQY